jgi:hypothetical protein
LARLAETKRNHHKIKKIIESQLSQKSTAIEHYKKFLDLWKDTDPGLPEVDDARERLAGLRGNKKIYLI